MSLEMLELKKKIFKIDRRHSVVNKSCNKIRMATHSKIIDKVVIRRKWNTLSVLENTIRILFEKVRKLLVSIRISKLRIICQDHF